jgi:hypothetical protein
MIRAMSNERPFPFSKDALDTVNSLTWFLMDAFWMLGTPNIAFIFVLPTLLSGLGLLYIEKRRTVFWINLSINCWIWMNTLWMMSDLLQNPEMLLVARGVFALGLLFIIFAVKSSDNLRETFSHFRRFRLMKIKK